MKRPLVPHLARMAETRSKARAFKDALGISAVSLEELGEDDEVLEQGRNNVHELPDRRPTRSPVSDAQIRYLRRLFSQRGVRGDELDRAICDAAGVEAVHHLDRHVASALIDELKQVSGT